MARIAAYLARIDDPSTSPLVGEHPADVPLLRLLAYLALADGVVQDDERALLRLFGPEGDDAALDAWARSLVATPFVVGDLLAVCATPQDRWDSLRFAARMVCLDGEIADEERTALRELADALQLPERATEATIAEVVAPAGAVPAATFARSLQNMLWRHLVPTRDDLEGELAAFVPADATLVCTLELGDAPIGGLFVEGLLARFDGGPAFLRWAEIATYTRVPVPGAGFHLRTVDGRHLACSESKLRDLGGLLDFLYGRIAIPLA